MSNVISVTLNDPKAGLSAQIYASRPGIVTTGDLEADGDATGIKLIIGPDFKPSDYLVSVTQKGSRPSPQTRLLAGTWPVWAQYGDNYRDWIADRNVTQSAIDYLSEHLPGNDDTRAKFEVCYVRATLGNPSIGQVKAAWSTVAKLFGLNPDEIAGNTGSRTAVLAMPTRIAQKISKGRNKPDQWQPPVPRPEYQDPKTSGRVLVAPVADSK